MKKLLCLLLILFAAAGCKPERLSPVQQETARLQAKYRKLLAAKDEARKLANVRAYYAKRGVN